MYVRKEPGEADVSYKCTMVFVSYVDFVVYFFLADPVHFSCPLSACRLNLFLLTLYRFWRPFRPAGVPAPTIRARCYRTVSGHAAGTGTQLSPKSYQEKVRRPQPGPSIPIKYSRTDNLCCNAVRQPANEEHGTTGLEKIEELVNMKHNILWSHLRDILC